MGKSHIARIIAVIARRKTDQARFGFDRLERVSKTLGNHLYASVRHAVGVRRNLVCRSRFAVWPLGNCREGPIARQLCVLQSAPTSGVYIRGFPDFAF